MVPSIALHLLAYLAILLSGLCLGAVGAGIHPGLGVAAAVLTAAGMLLNGWMYRRPFAGAP